jgi:O-antigen ligase
MNKLSSIAAHPRALSSEKARRPAFVVAVALLVGAFLIAGGARDDIVSLMVWRPLSALCLAVALVFYWTEAWRRGKALILVLIAVIALVCVHLVPLPPAVWTALPGRQIIAAVYHAAGMELPWQPLSIAQARTWNALFSLVGPLAMLIVALVLPEGRQRQLLHVVIGVGLLSGITGMIQALGPTNGQLYLYRITNNGTSVGLFANRNHQAAMLASLLPLLAASLSLFSGKPDRLFFHRALTLALAALLVPLILMTGSRAGIALGLVGAALAWFWVFRSPESTGRVVGIRSEHRSRLVGVAIAFALLVIVAVIAMRTPALSRLMETDPSSELRVQAFPIVIAGVWKYFPLGSGMGTFVEAYQIDEPDALISDQYFNHAHNDFAELLMTGGVPALLLLIVISGLWLVAFFALKKARKTKRDDPGFVQQVLGRAGLAVIAIFALASVTDYPLRVPSLMLYGTLVSVWGLNAFKISRKIS